ncbi:MAG: collagen-like protein [Acidobacteriota bacterium]|nr:collagen-like protein [Acidobacteriota bacterium]
MNVKVKAYVLQPDIRLRSTAALLVIEATPVLRVSAAARGLSGPKGDPGERGEKGDDGAAGPAGTPGTNGAAAFVYIAYSDDAGGNGFTTAFDGTKNYIAIKSTTVAIAAPVAADFAGLWKNYKGADGAAGVGASAPAIADFTPQTNVSKNAVVTSNAAAVSGNAVDVFPLTVRGDGTPQIDINADDNWQTDRIARNGDNVRVRLTSPPSNLTERIATLFAQSISKQFSVTTLNALWQPDFLGASVLKFWLKADALSLGDNDPVAAWTDASGNNNAGASAGAARPIYKAGILNNLPVVRFGSGGVVNYLDTPLINIGARTYAFLIKRLGVYVGNYHSIVMSLSAPYFQVYVDASGLYHWNASPNHTTASQFVAAWQIVVARQKTDGTMTFRVNGAETSSASGFSNVSVNTAIQIGAFAAGPAGMNADMPEILMADSSVSDANLERIEGYFAHKYELTGLLPSGHAYKTSAP